jgi:hypothetical protein
MSGMLLWALMAGVGPVIDDVEMGTGGASDKGVVALEGAVQ